MNAGESPSQQVLLVDGDLDRRLAMHAFLESAGYEVQVSKGLVPVQGLAPTLVVLDATGDRAAVQSALQRLREQSLGSGAAVVGVLDGQDGDMQARARALGVDDCVPWPIGRAEFLWRVRSVLRWKSEPAADSCRLARIQVEELLQVQRQREQTLSLLIHDMKNPLSGVISNVDYLSSAVQGAAAIDPELPSCAQDVLQASRRLYRMVQSVLDLNQSEDGLLAVNLQPVGVRELLEAAHSACRARLRDKGMQLLVTQPEHALVLHVDQDMLVRLLANLLDNAISATPNGGTIELSALDLPDAIELRVKDQGPSLPTSERVRLERESLQPTRSTRARRGLGLRACRVLAEAHGGKLSLQEHAPRGATVCLVLPRPA